MRRVGLRLARAALAGLFAALALVAGARDAGAQSIEIRILPEAEPLPATPRVVALVKDVPRDRYPLSIELDAARSRLPNGDVAGVFYTATLPGDTVTFVTRALFPANDSVYLRFVARDRDGRTLAQRTDGFKTAPRVTLRSPIGAFGITLFDRQPQFVWSAAKVEVPPGPWIFDFTVINAQTGDAAFFLPGITDTVVRPALPLEANTPYRWQVKARLGNRLDSGPDTSAVVVTSQSTFVIQSSDQPTVTLLYQNFPNPFPTPVSPRTCVWFDLKSSARVSLVVRDLRGNLVRTLVNDESLAAGSYGRGGEGQQSGCVDQFSWDGTTADGRTAPPGVYLLHFRADGVESVRKMLFRGR